MSIPGSNLLQQALRVIARQTVYYFQATGRSLNNVGQQVTSYAPRQTIVGSFQPVPRNLYQQYGLDLTKDYWTFYSLNNLVDIGRDVSNDQIQFNGQRFQCEANNDWYSIDKWKGVLCCLIDVPDVVINVFGFASPSYVNFNNGNFYNDG